MSVIDMTIDRVMNDHNNGYTTIGLCSIVHDLCVQNYSTDFVTIGLATNELQNNLKLSTESWGAAYSIKLGDRRTRNGYLRRLGVLFLIRRAVRDFV